MPSNSALRLILTRPKPQAAGWETALAEAGFDVALLPLIDIQLCPAPAVLPDLQACDAVFLVSRNALDGLLAWYGQAAILAAPVRWLCPGAGTAQQLLALGIPAARIAQPAADAPQDSEHLWLALQSGRPLQAGSRLLIVQGQDQPTSPSLPPPNLPPPNWLGQQAAALGVQINHISSYQRSAPNFTVAQAELAQAAAQDGSIWLFSSSQAIANLAAALPDTRWTGTPCLATHARIAAAARALGFTTHECQPQLNDIAHALHQISRS